MVLSKACLNAPIGRLVIAASEVGIVSIYKSDETIASDGNEITAETMRQLTEYFEGRRKDFDIALDLSLGSEFMQKVWLQLTKIPYGKTISYLQLARSVGGDKHTRAVGMANAKNPIPIIVPCHRVVGSDGSLIGFSMGMDVKIFLLNHERPQHGLQASLF